MWGMRLPLRRNCVITWNHGDRQKGGWGVRELGTRGLVSIRLNTGGVIQEKEKKLINNEFDSSLDHEHGILRS